MRVAPVLERYGDFAQFLDEPRDDEAVWEALRRSETSGRPVGDRAWIASLEADSGRTIAARKRGRKPKEKSKLSPN